MAGSNLALSAECTPVRELHPELEKTPPSVAIVEAIAKLEDVDPTSLPPIYESVDSTALDQLIGKDRAEAGSTLVVCFDYQGWNVFVRGDGSIVIGDPAGVGESAPLF
ncbi:HalOD1 output domain-containing protein [Haloplanus rubicundus]|uniref:Halobacterial output domain-containing protein n=1 Tax=Haloplanus rubicundus TaxID=1547898 RepID=A0A345EBS4_9EURY|nr:HalOD1 output domain-containing protein [Haloplanus rubicundus]AXG09646.1 hypothetical protein DU484_07075 [Haloplanus rubicundus]